MPEQTLFQPLTWSDLLVMAPELALGAWFVLLVVLELLLPRKVSRSWIGGLTLTGLLGAFILVLMRMIESNGEVISLLGDSYRIDDFASLLKLLFLGATALIVLLGLGTVQQDRAITDKGEYFYLLLPAVIGAMTMASSENLVTLYIGLELLSITSYVLVGLRRKSSLSSEAAFKYVVTGGISSAFILFGMSYLYGVTGSVQLAAINAALPGALERYEALVYVGFLMMIIGFAIKIAAAPFHAWSLDVYQGAPTPIAAFLAVVSKGAALAVIFRLMFATALFANPEHTAVSGMSDELFFIVLLVAAASMLYGTLAALRQLNVKRLLALSGVANAGYLLVPIGISFTVGHLNNMSEFLFYLIAYLLMTIGAFAVHTAVSRAAGHDELKGYAGMYYRSPWTAIAMILLVLSLAGLPVSAGFFGKLFILLGAERAQAYWIVVIMVLSSVISYYFYFGLIRQMFMRSSNGLSAASSSLDFDEDEGFPSRTIGSSPSLAVQEVHAGRIETAGASEQSPAEGTVHSSGPEAGLSGPAASEQAAGVIRIPWPTAVVIAICAVLTLGLGIVPGPLVDIIQQLFSFPLPSH
ncbi:NADH-quinone oxidoreductase subunit N [Paenibacillus sp. 1011MAR3C5]|uniref:NADH-quinone oxidoreductase subunit N n=1 Tax=Paenibacillus sp. 1011MAR3C5 TaxID=1675787 RepID=UPI000E6BF143|nr:NADH-quinone oxidoreductase subunit N [Paenibacillus sp. 1011MAR3C5]RJE85601.1 NADH-quinone oxidoreductase subunit N [Paenibacillus sp. 1011MAR3C5]